MRAAGCVVNDWADRDIDGKVRRTRERPLVTGELSSQSALVLLCVLLLCAASLLFFLNFITVQLACVAAFLALNYPFAKRFTRCPQAVLGLAFAWGVPMAFSSISLRVPLEAWLWLAGTWCWVMAYDTQYAMVDRDDDQHLPIGSSALWWGAADRTVIACLLMMAVMFWLWVGVRYHLRAVYFVGLFVVASAFVWQLKLIWQRENQACFRAFKQNAWVGLWLFLSVVLGLM